MDKNDCPESFSKWLIKEDLLTVSDVGVLASEEKDVEARIIQKVRPRIDRIRDETAITKAWIACRSLVGEEKTDERA